MSRLKASHSINCQSGQQPIQPKSQNIKWMEYGVKKSLKEDLLGQVGCNVWFTGLSGAGKSTIACTLEHALAGEGKLTSLMDGDNIRHGLNSNLGFSANDREENIRRIGEVAKLFVDCGIICITSFISPYKQDRLNVRGRFKQGEFIEVYVKTPLELCEQRDPKGLYKLARAGKIKGFTGIDDPYEEPDCPEIILEAVNKDGVPYTAEQHAEQIFQYLIDNQIIKERTIIDQSYYDVKDHQRVLESKSFKQ